MFVTIEIDADNIVASVEVADDAEIYCGVEVTLVFIYVFGTNVTTEPVPFSKMLIIVSKDDVILLT